MTQRDRDRLIALKKAKKGLITQRQAAEEIGQTERHVRRLLVKLKGEGDQAIIHGRRGKRSNRKLDEKSRAKAVAILGQRKYRGFGPTLASEYLGKHHQITVSRETVRAWMIEARLWRAREQRVRRSMGGARGARDAASWCNGIPASTRGWKSAGQSCI